MLLETGYVYHIKDEYFDFVKGEKLMKNHENENTRPTYFCIKNIGSKVLWFIPMSSKVDKYRKLQEQKIDKNGVCDIIDLIFPDVDRIERILLEELNNDN